MQKVMSTTQNLWVRPSQKKLAQWLQHRNSESGIANPYCFSQVVVSIQ